MEQYQNLLSNCLHGTRKSNRTGVDTIGYIGDMCKYDLADGFPAITTRKLPWKSCFAEMLCFLRGYSNVEDFQKMGCKYWDANAKADYWVNNPNRVLEGDLGAIYGVQARNWHGTNGIEVDQLKGVVDKIVAGVDDRRLIVSHWQPAELNMMALPPCHLLYQFSIENGKLHLCMYQRSCDVPLGVPSNVAGYAWLLSVIAHIAKLEVGTLTHFMCDIHIYENQIDGAIEQAKRETYKLPTLYINPSIKTLEDLETWVTVADFDLVGYQHHEQINYEFAV